MSVSTLESELSKPSNENEIDLTEEVEDGKNKNPVKCRFCPSTILNPRIGTYIHSEFELPMMTKKENLPSSDGDTKDGTKYESLSHFLQINDMYTFENICFSIAVGDIKYLACADCEIGPVGYHNLNTKVSYIALARVRRGN
ncbi:UNVERIFIED_CONTAM: hypothetical protein PYX00_004846 [Menopon gallinae]|uniref:Guanine nucleotide exchange factor MSS4 n=1 Tax=Menopon gallinae TaxID=328185 RepID=A0AAW2I760_9NEOP